MFTLTDWEITIKNNHTDTTELVTVRARDQIEAVSKVGMQLIVNRGAEVGDYTQTDIRPAGSVYAEGNRCVPDHRSNP